MGIAYSMLWKAWEESLVNKRKNSRKTRTPRRKIPNR
jgi:hypothetical protein